MARIRRTIAALLIGTAAIAYGAEATGLVDSLADGVQRMAVAAGPGVPEATVRGDPARTPRAAPVAAPSETRAAGQTTSVHQALTVRSDALEQPVSPPPHFVRGLRLAQAPDAQPALKPVGSSRSDRGSTAAPGSTESLTRAIQSELKRVGCFAGEVDGDWGASTRASMQAFNDRVNAKLPTTQPDYILLTLLQGHSAKACGAQCPPGQAKNDAGTCLPRSVIAESRRRAAPDEGARADGTAAITTGAAPTTADGSPTVRTSETSRLASAARIERPAADAPPPALSRAEIERQRIAAAEARRQQSAAEAAARAEGERLARLAAAEKARQAAEARRQEELARLEERAARRATKAEESAARQQSALLAPTIPVAPTPSALPDLPASEAASPPPESAAFAPSASQIVAAAPTRAARKSTKRRASKPRGARYVGRFEPSSAYRLGRLAPTRVAAPVVLSYVARQRRNPQAIFRELQHRMP